MTPLRVLVVDDSAFARKVLRESLGASPELQVVATASDGIDALEKIAELKPDVITLDLVMPNLDGLGVLKALAPEQRRRVVIVSMADGDSELAIAALCLGGAWKLVRARRDARAFTAAKSLAACGLVLLFLLYYLGFVLVGGEWFDMWQSNVWNGQAKAVMFLTCAMFVLIVLLLPESPDHR